MRREVTKPLCISTELQSVKWKIAHEVHFTYHIFIVRENANEETVVLRIFSLNTLLKIWSVSFRQFCLECMRIQIGRQASDISADTTTFLTSRVSDSVSWSRIFARRRKFVDDCRDNGISWIAIDNGILIWHGLLMVAIHKNQVPFETYTSSEKVTRINLYVIIAVILFIITKANSVIFLISIRSDEVYHYYSAQMKQFSSWWLK